MKKKSEKESEVLEKYYEDTPENKKTVKQRLKDKLEDAEIAKKEQIVLSLSVLIAIHISVLAIRYIYCIFFLDSRILSNNPFYIILAIAGPIFLWIYSTDSKLFEVYRPKKIFFIVVVANAVLTVMQPIYTFSWRIIVPHMMSLKLDAAMTKEFVIAYTRLAMAAATTFFMFLIYRIISPIFLSEDAFDKIQDFQLSDKINKKSIKGCPYDLPIAKVLETGEIFNISEGDRTLHTLAIGTTGTGKTSTVLLPSIANDLKIKLINRELREKELVKFLHSDKGKVSNEYRYGKEFDENYIIPEKDYEEEFNDIKKNYPDVGMTIIAPNNSHVDMVIKLAKANGNIKVNCFDPVRKYEKDYDNVRDVGLQPFYVPLDLDEATRASIIKYNAESFSDVLVTINERNASTEAYFRDINVAVTTNVAIIVQLYFNMNRKQASVADVHDCIDYPPTLENYVSFIEEAFKINVMVSSKKKQSGRDDRNNHTFTAESLHEDEEHLKEEIIKNAQSNDARSNPYYHVILFVKTELLGDGSEKMFDQARGLRNLISNFFMQQEVLDTLSATDENRLDLDETLSKNEITVVNTAICIGNNSSTGIGLFYLLLLKRAVLRRPGNEKTRSLHFIYVDEATQYMNPVYEDMTMLFRQYRCGVVLLTQSLSQFSKTSASQYIGKIVQGVGTQVVFGRLSAEEMKIYETLAGVEYIKDVQKTESHNSILDPNATASYSERTTNTRKNKIEGTDLRNRKFREGAIFSVRKSSVLEAKICKFSFVPKKELKKKNVRLVNWSLFLPEEETPIELPTNEEKFDEDLEDAVIYMDETPFVEIERADEEFVDTKDKKTIFADFFANNTEANNESEIADTTRK